MSDYKDFISKKVISAHKSERAIERWTNKGDLVFDPFGGIASVPYMSVKMGRKGKATELNTEYWKDGCMYLRQAEQEKNAITLFDLV